MTSWKSSSVSTCGIQIPREELRGGGLWFLSAGSTITRCTVRSSDPDVRNHEAGERGIALMVVIATASKQTEGTNPTLDHKRNNALTHAGAGMGCRATPQQHPCRSWDRVENRIPASLQELGLCGDPSRTSASFQGHALWVF